MPILLRQHVAQKLIADTFGSKEGLAAAWEARCETQPTFPRARQRAALYRWITDGVPTSISGEDETYFALCALLNVDPLTLFDFEKNEYFSRFAWFRQLIYFGRSAPSEIATLLRMYRPGDVWPSDAIALNCFGRRWIHRHLTNRDNWRHSDYGLLKATFSDTLASHPKAVHIAYRRIASDVNDTMWRYYGTVMAIDGELELYTESGAFKKMSQVLPGEIRFRTYFGGRPVEWRVASLHEFTLETEFPFNDETTISFTW